jgi:hypothetical protein
MKRTQRIGLFVALMFAVLTFMQMNSTARRLIADGGPPPPWPPCTLVADGVPPPPWSPTILPIGQGSTFRT